MRRGLCCRYQLSRQLRGISLFGPLHFWGVPRPPPLPLSSCYISANLRKLPYSADLFCSFDLCNLVFHTKCQSPQPHSHTAGQLAKANPPSRASLTEVRNREGTESGLFPPPPAPLLPLVQQWTMDNVHDNFVSFYNSANPRSRRTVLSAGPFQLLLLRVAQLHPGSCEIRYNRPVGQPG